MQLIGSCYYSKWWSERMVALFRRVNRKLPPGHMFWRYNFCPDADVNVSEALGLGPLSLEHLTVVMMGFLGISSIDHKLFPIPRQSGIGIR